MAGRIEIGSFKMEWGAQKSATVGPTYDLKGTMAAEKIWGYHDNFSDEVVTERRAMGLAPVYICLNVLSRTIAALPQDVMIFENDQIRPMGDHPASELIGDQANQYMSAANLYLTSMIHSHGWGNSVIGINRDSRARPKSLELICPGEWDVVKQDGDAWYSINGETYPSRDVLHYRWFSLDGLCGISPIRQNAITMGKAFKQNRYSAMALGERSPDYLAYEGNLSPEQRAQNQKSWKEDRLLGKIPILTGKWDYNTTLIPPGDAEYVDTAKLTDNQIYGIFQIPPAFAQQYERMTWSNAEQADLTYAKHTIVPICRVMEQENNMKLFTEKEKKNMFTKYNVNGLLRGDSKARAEFYKAMRDIGAMNGNEIREREDMNKYNGGDIFTVQSANIPIDQLKDFYSQKVASTVPPQVKNHINGHHHVN